MSLFSGIGGVDIAAEMTGFRTVAFVEINPYCQRVLNLRWPSTPIFGDIHHVNGSWFPGVCLISGGFPCQDISLLEGDFTARKCLQGSRSSLWKEMIRIVNESKPKYVLVENVAVLRRRGLDTILRDLAESGYDAEWGTVSASAVGAYHQRNRLFIVAHHQSLGIQRVWPERFEVPRSLASALTLDGMGDRQWKVEPDVRRVPNGVPARVDRLKCLGNAVVPQQVYPILATIATIERGEQASRNG